MKRSRVGHFLKNLFQSKKQRLSNEATSTPSTSSSYYEMWEKGDQLGKGGHGEVYVALFESKEPVAMKCISKHDLKSQ